MTSPDTISREGYDLFKYVFRQRWEEFAEELNDAMHGARLHAKRSALLKALERLQEFNDIDEMEMYLRGLVAGLEGIIKEWETGELGSDPRPRPEDREIDRDAIFDHR